MHSKIVINILKFQIMEKKETWKPVTIGGLTGILMGAGSVYGAQKLISEAGDDVQSANSTEGVRCVNTNDDLSFAEAFNVARTELGPGGVFTWHGNIYNTYTAEEWQAMTENEQKEFAEEVNPEVSPSDLDIAEIEDVAADGEDVLSTEDIQTEQPREDVAQATTWNDIVQEENDVRVIGYGDVDIADGRSVTMQELEVNGQRVAIVDVDKDGDPDIAMTDLNQNHEMDEGEVIDLHTGEAVSFTNDDMSDNDYSADFDPINT